MIMKKTAGEGFPGVLDYVFRHRDCDKEKAPAEHIGGTVWGSMTEMKHQFEATGKIRPEIGKPVVHFSLSLPSDDGKLDSGKWLDIAEDFMRGMKFPEDTAWVAVRHSDTAHDHIHIVVSRISLSGKVWDDSNDFLRGMTVTSRLEKEYGLVRTDKKRKDRRIKASDYNMAQRDVLSERAKIMNLVDLTLAFHPSYEDFKRALAASGVTVTGYRSQKTDMLKGITFELSGVRVKGSQLGRGYSAPGLIARGLRDFGKKDLTSRTAQGIDGALPVGRPDNDRKDSGRKVQKKGPKTAASRAFATGSNPCRGCLNPTNCEMCVYKGFRLAQKQKTR